MMAIKQLCFSLIYLVLLAGPVSANEAGSRTFRVLFLAPPQGAPKSLHLFDGAKSQEVALPGMNFSPVYKLRGGNLKISLSPDPVATPEEVNPKAPSLRIPEGTRDFYLLVSSDKKNPVAPVKMKLVAIDDAKFGKGDMLWFNMTSNAIGGNVGRQKLAMKAASRKVLKAPARERGDYPVKLAYRIPGKDHLYPLCETNWNHDPRSRMVVFVITESGRRAPRVVGFSDFRQEEKAGN